jgi:hypothetical protein
MRDTDDAGRTGRGRDLVDDVVDELREAGPLLAVVENAARGVFAWHGVDAELAALQYDSRLDSAALVRGGTAVSAAPYTLRFGRQGLAVELTRFESTVVGQLVPAGPGEIQLLTPDGPGDWLPTDDLGCFRLPDFPRGPVRLRCRSDGAEILTESIPG